MEIIYNEITSDAIELISQKLFVEIKDYLQKESNSQDLKNMKNCEKTEKE